LKGFYPKEGAVIEEDKGRDFISIDLAVDTLYAEMESRLKAVKPNIFMGQEFPVVGPNLVSYQNFLTGFVGVENTQVIREKMVNNRLLYGKYSPFMEVVAITPRDSEIDIARKLQSVLFGNPYLSLYVSTLPETSKKTIRFWMNYWKTNHKVLFEGNFEPLQVSRYYPVIRVETDKQMVVAQYDDYTVNLPSALTKTIDVINSKLTGDIRFMVANPSINYNYEIFNCKGESVSKGILKSKSKNQVDVEVPAAGLIRVYPAN
jgi:alpha-galactosidase